MSDYFYDKDGNILGTSEEVIMKLEQENQELKNAIEEYLNKNIATDEKLEELAERVERQITISKEKILKIFKEWKVISYATENKLQEYWDCEDDITGEDKLDKIATEIIGDHKNE